MPTPSATSTPPSSRAARKEYAFSATADGQVIVSHAIEDSLDGTDRLRNIEKVQFSDGNALNIIVGTPRQWRRGCKRPTCLNGTAQDDLILGLDWRRHAERRCR